jgi:hypothetical protein
MGPVKRREVRSVNQEQIAEAIDLRMLGSTPFQGCLQVLGMRVQLGVANGAMDGKSQQF